MKAKARLSESVSWEPVGFDACLYSTCRVSFIWRASLIPDCPGSPADCRHASHSCEAVEESCRAEQKYTKMDKSVQLGRFFVGPRIRRSAKIKQNPVERMFNGVSVPRTGITGLLRVVSRFHNYMTCRCSVLALCYQRLCFITDIRSCRRSCIALVVCCEERMAFQDFSILFC